MAGAPKRAGEVVAKTTPSFDGYPGPVLIWREEGGLSGRNAAGDDLLRHLDADGMDQFLRLVRDADANGAAAASIVLAKTDPAQWFDITVTPSEDGSVLLMARDTSLDVAMRTALIDSRQRFKDLIDASGDIAWEVNAAGAFTYISADSLAGYPSETLIGVKPAELLVEASMPEISSFEPRDRGPRRTIWVRGADGVPRCLELAALPLYTAEGNWSGARGLVRDITIERQRDLDFAQIRSREQVAAFIVNVIRNEAHPQLMLEAAVQIVRRATGGNGSALYRIQLDGSAALAATVGTVPGMETLQQVFDAVASGVGEFDMRLARRRVIGVATRYGGETNGVLLVFRPNGDPAWSDETKELLRAIEGHIGIALRQVADRERLELQSRTDELTKLLNRRAFMHDLSGRLNRCKRQGRRGALLFIDLDNFKVINDRLGHDAGDAVLRAFADILLRRIRDYDLAARFGGDEFALWLEDMTSDHARDRALQLLADTETLISMSVSRDKPLSLSIGVAIFESTDEEEANALIARADSAMYQAKSSGKNQVALAPTALQKAEIVGHA